MPKLCKVQADVVKCVLIVLIFSAPAQIRAELIVEIPSPQGIVNMSRGVVFSAVAVTDEPVPPEAKALNPNFTIKVYFRQGVEKITYRPESGAVFAKIAISGVPAKRLLPDGEYYLWIGGDGELQRSALAKIDGTFVREVEVLAGPTRVEGSTAKTPDILSTISIEKVVAFGTVNPPGGGLPPRIPPKDPPKPPPDPGRTWREVRVPWTPNPDGSIPPPRWIRVPDN